MSPSYDDSNAGWQTDPDNPMLGPDGQLRDAAERLGQFVYSPLDEVPCPPSPQSNIMDNDLPGSMQGTQNAARLKRIVKQVMRRNPFEVFEQQKLAKLNCGSASGSASQGTAKPLSKFGFGPGKLKLPTITMTQMLGKKEKKICLLFHRPLSLVLNPLVVRLGLPTCPGSIGSEIGKAKPKREPSLMLRKWTMWPEVRLVMGMMKQTRPRC
jgi:hypothetical protein